MAQALVPANFDAQGNVIIPNAAPLPAGINPRFDFTILRGQDLRAGWADVSGARYVYTDAHRGVYNIVARKHRFLKRNNPPAGRPELYEVYVDSNMARQPIVEESRPLKADLAHIVTRPGQNRHQRLLRGGAVLINANREAFLQKYFPILTVRKEPMPAGITNIHKFSIVPSPSRTVREGFALATFHDTALTRARRDENDALRPEHRKASQAIWTSLVLPFLMLIKPSARASDNDVSIRVTMVFVVESISAATPQSLFYLTIPMRYYHISDSDSWLRDLQYSFLNRLQYTDIKRTDSDRRVRSIELITITFVKNNLAAGPNNLGGFLPSQDESSQSNLVRTSSVSSSFSSTSSFQSVRTKNRMCEDLFKKNTFKWSDKTGWYLTSFKSEAKQVHEETSARRMCLYWACLKGIRLIEHSYYDIPEDWKTSKQATSANLQFEVHRYLKKVMNITDFNDVDGVSFGSPILQALADLLKVDIRINDSNWNILVQYRPNFRQGETYPKPKFDGCAIAANRQIFSLPPVCRVPTIVLVLLEHVQETLTSGMGMTFDVVTEQWNSSYACKDVVEKETKQLRVPGQNIIPNLNRDTSLWHYWLVVGVGAKEEQKMSCHETLSLETIPLCGHCEINKCRQSLLSCVTHGPSPSNAGDRRRRVFKKAQNIVVCPDCSVSFAEECFHICSRPCPYCSLQIPIFEQENGTHFLVCKEYKKSMRSSVLSSVILQDDDTFSVSSHMSEQSIAASTVDSIVSRLSASKQKAEKRKKKYDTKKVGQETDNERCDKCGIVIKSTTIQSGKHKCNPDCVQYYQRFKNKIPMVWSLGKGKTPGNTFDGYIIWDLETFPCADDNYRMKVYRCGLYHNTFAKEQMGVEGTYVDFACTNGTHTGNGDVILRMLQYLASPNFNNFIALSYFGCVFDHYLLLQYILSDVECSKLFKVHQPDFVDEKFSWGKSKGKFHKSDIDEQLDRRSKEYKEAKKKEEDKRMKQNWVVKSKRIFSMWLSEPTEQEDAEIVPRYGIKFIDLGLFTQCSLKQACKDFGLSKDESKQIFPHDFIGSWSDLLYEGPVPDKKYFPASSRDEAAQMKYEYEREGKVWNLMQVSEEYLRMDVLSTRQVFLKFSDTISQKLGIELTGSITLPSLAQKLLKKTLKEKAKVVIDLAKTPAEGTDFRKSIFGGRVMPLRDRFISPALDEMEASLVLLRRAYAKILAEFIKESCFLMAGDQGLTNDFAGDFETLKLPEDDYFLLFQACTEVVSASKVCPPENVFVLLTTEHLPKMHSSYKHTFDLVCKNVPDFMDWNDWVAMWYDKIKAEGCLRAVDVSSLYPSSMAFHPYPTGGHDDVPGFQLNEMNEIVKRFNSDLSFDSFSYHEIVKRVADLRSCMHWPAAGIFYIKYIPNQRLAIPVLPRKEKGMLLWDLISAEGWYNSVDIENAVVMGYQIEFVRGYQWIDTAPIFKDVIMDLFNIKQEAENNGDVTLRSIAKLLMNSMYGKMLQKPVREYTGLVYNDYDLASFLKHYMWTGFEAVGVDNLCILAHGISKPILKSEAERVVQWSENDGSDIQFEDPSGQVRVVNELNEMWLDQQPIQLGSFILGYSRRIMLQYFCHANPTMDVEKTAYYTDTDSIFLSDEQFHLLEKDGFVAEGLGLLSDDFKGAIGIEAYFNNPKSYLVSKIKKAKGKDPAQLWSQIKAKGIAKSCLSNTYKMGYMDEGEHWLQVPVTVETMSMDYYLNIFPTKTDPQSVSENSLPPGAEILKKTSFKRGDMFGMDNADPEVYALLSDLQEIDNDARITFNSAEQDDIVDEYSWEESYDEKEGDSVPINISQLSIAVSPQEMREKRLQESQSCGRLDKFSFINARRQADGRSKRPLMEHVTFPTFKRFLGRNNKEIESGHENFSIVPKTISRSFGSRLFLGAKYVMGHDKGFYRPWNNSDVELFGVGNAALARAGPKGEKWATEFDKNLDEDAMNF